MSLHFRRALELLLPRPRLRLVLGGVARCAALCPRLGRALFLVLALVMQLYGWLERLVPSVSGVRSADARSVGGMRAALQLSARGVLVGDAQAHVQWGAVGNARGCGSVQRVQKITLQVKVVRRMRKQLVRVVPPAGRQLAQSAFRDDESGDM
jgi:hypothetical protein